jgi:predicted ArsR family transcriptional regulator
MGMGLIEAIADPIRLAIVRHLATHDTASLNELADAATAHPETARRHVAQLCHAGVLEALPRTPDGETRGRPPVRYRLADRDQIPARLARENAALAGDVSPPAYG